ncbi:hypothetical protein [Pseudonocardia abyssalis]|uniref:Uncharacterized protein n=1 Tax=Pseudonocardia abyssalis TaxID=2792008 RepID=A0ABS6UM77_9PSEU|nr:hypothetical protein [Pseudonocardia abyssalis]MBW0115604.1 hypothetical protein [Pseudonocardia abyssalis]MBW0133353.1 hypothetical protein [Pseudonocardia abyssalis]
MLVHVVAIAATGGPPTGPVSLRTPATFAETGALVCWSLALVLPVLRMRREHLVGGAAVLFAVGETAVIGVQASRGVPSHNNFTTPLAALTRGGAAGTAGVFVVGVLVLLVATLQARVPGDVRLGIAAGALVLHAGIGMVIVNDSGVLQEDRRRVPGPVDGRPGAAADPARAGTSCSRP